MEDLNGFELGVVLAHEAMRNGRNDGEEGQRLETIDAVLAHSDHAMQVLEKYGLGALGYQMGQEAMIYAMMQNGDVSREDFEAYVDGTYDSTEDFWRLMEDGTIEFDGRTDLYYDPDGDGPLEEVLILDLYATGLESSFAELMGYAYSTAREKEQVAKDMKDLGLSPNESRTGYNSRNARTWYWDVAENNGVTVGDAPSDFLKDLTVTGRFEKEHLYNVLLEREEVHEKNFHIFDNIASAVGYNPMTYDEWEVQFEVDYVNGLYDDYTTNGLNIEQNFLPSRKTYTNADGTTGVAYSHPDSDLVEVREITVHFTASESGNNAADTRAYFASGKVQSSSHFVIGSFRGEILQLLPTNKIAWTNGGEGGPTAEARARYPEARFIGRWYYGIGNSNPYSLTIEANNMRDTVNTINSANEPGFFASNTYNSMVSLVAHYLVETNLGIDDVKRHYDSTGKICPKIFSPDIYDTQRNGQNSFVRFNENYQDFLDRVELMRKLIDEGR
jgi:hypothetical protein